MSEQVGTHSVPLGGGDDRERPPELETPRSAAAPFEPVGAVPHVEEQPRGRGWRPWAIIGVAIAIPAAVAAVLVTTLGGSDAPAERQAAQTPAPAPVVEQTTTAPPPPAAVATPVRPAAAAPDRAAAPAAPAADSTLTASRADAAAESAATGAAAASTVAAELATPEERLRAWGDMTQVTIVEGDSLWALAIEYSTTVEAISLVNAVNDPAELSVGAVLSIPVGFAESLVPAETTVVEEAAGSTETAASMATRFDTVPPADTSLADWPNVVEWTIQPGDSLSALATTFETNADAIMSLNGIEDPDLLYAGSTIRIPVGFTGNAPAVETGGTDTAAQAAAAPAETDTTTQSAAAPTETDTTTQSAATDAVDNLEDANAAPAAESAAPAAESSDGGDDYLEGAAAPTQETAGSDDYLEGANDDGDYLEN